MSSNSSSTGSNGNGKNSVDDSQLYLAIVALVVSVFAFCISILQALQQYFSSTKGISACSSAVIGDWAKYRQYGLKNFQLEVRFRVPVLFVAPPDNEKGPLGHASVKTIFYMDGTPQSYEDTKTSKHVPDGQEKKQHGGSGGQENIRTADNERATWIALMTAIQNMEHDSDEWQKRLFSYARDKPLKKSRVAENHTLVVGMQIKHRSWETMPASLSRPYATSTIAHFVEIMAMLGIYWKEFDRSNNRYRAQGNGFSVTGSLVPDLGIGFTFQLVGKNCFRDNRLIPNNYVKELCFGFCPTIFRTKGKNTIGTDEQKDKGTLQLGRNTEIAQTLASLGCNTKTSNYFSIESDKNRHSHLFPLPFEMLGMVGIVLQIKETAFTMLPNPTYFTWDHSAFSLPNLLSAFETTITQNGDLLREKAHVLEQRGKMDESKKLQAKAQMRDSACITYSARISEIMADSKAVHTELEQNKSVRQNNSLLPRPQKVEAAPASSEGAKGVTSGLSVGLLPRLSQRKGTFMQRIRTRTRTIREKRYAVDAIESEKRSPELGLSFEMLHAAIEHCDKYLRQPEIEPYVVNVFCLHLQEVLKYLNTPTEAAEVVRTSGESGGATVTISDSQDARPLVSKDSSVPEISLQELDSASFRERHRLLAEVYVFSIRDRVRRMTLVRADADDEGDGVTGLDDATATDELTGRTLTKPIGPSDVDDIWFTLVFRMLCWLLLHDFHNKDIQISKSDVFGSRLPVYIL